MLAGLLKTDSIARVCNSLFQNFGNLTRFKNLVFNKNSNSSQKNKPSNYDTAPKYINIILKEKKGQN